VSGLSRIYVAPGNVEGELVRFGDEDLRHIRSVLRLRVGDSLLATDGTGAEYHVRIASGPCGLQGRIESRSTPGRESPLRITLVQAIPKKELMDLVVQKAVELGVSEIRPVLTARTVVQLEGSRKKAKHERWERIVAAALAQSGRTRMPLLRGVQSWEEFLLEPVDSDMKLILCEGKSRLLHEVLGSSKEPASAVLAVGPEGGWEAGEIASAAKGGFETVGLGPRTLRTETAGLAALSVLQFRYGDLGGGRFEGEDSGNHREDL